MALVIISILIAVWIGYTRPLKVAWLIILLLPLLGPSGFYIGAESRFPLSAYRLSFFALVAIMVKYRMRVFYLIKTAKYIHIIIFYFISIFILQIQHYFVPTVFGLFPFYFIALFLPFIIIREEKDLYKLANVLVLQSVIISIFIIIEYYSSFSLVLFIRNLSGIDASYLQTKGTEEITMRSGVYRAAGLHGNAVQTSFHLIVLFPFTIYFLQYRKSIVRYIPLLMIIIGFSLLQSRAAIIALVFTLLFLTYFAISNKSIKKVFKNILALLFFLSIALLIATFFDNEIVKIVERLISDLSFTLFDSRSLITEASTNISNKIDRIPVALEMILGSPIFGYFVSPRYAYFELMHTDDLPSIFLNLLGGGILLGTLFLLLMYRIVIGLYQKISILANSKLNNLLLYASAATFGGFFVTFSVMAEEQFFTIFIIYTAIQYSFTIMKISNTNNSN